MSKKDAFSILVKWGAQVNHDLKDFKFVQPEEVQSIVGSWHMAIRLDGRVISPPASKISLFFCFFFFVFCCFFLFIMEDMITLSICI